MDEDELKAATKMTIKDGRKPAEIYRTDLITAMKIPDHQVISPEAYFKLCDPWKQEWERGVQVPVNMESLPQPSFKLCQSEIFRSSDFKVSNKLLKHDTKEENSKMYDLDDEDIEWLKTLNRTRKYKGHRLVDEYLMEKAITCLEDQCHTNMGETISTEKGLSIEYDEDIVCDVCRVPDCEDGNEIVFCDVCDVAVHQACYGIKKLPIGSWVCKPCTQMISNKPCLLCPNKGGAMKRTTSKHHKGWVHMNCALWIPEVGIGDVEKMEPITRLEAITPGRWNLLCYLCKEKQGACIQCTVKSCVKAFHVTCGFNNNLIMKTVLDESAPDGVRHVCYCCKHGAKRNCKSPRKTSTSSARRTPNKTPSKLSNTSTPTKLSNCSSPSNFKTPTKPSIKEIEEQENMRQKKLRHMEEEFYKFADVKVLATEVKINKELAKTFHNYWTLKRKSKDDASLLPPTAEQQERLAGKQIKPYERATMEVERVVKLRQDLERIRNLCYMIEKREKQKRELTKIREVVFRKGMDIIEKRDMTSDDIEWATSCCKNNFTEYIHLQNLDLKYPRRRSTGYKPRKKRRRMSSRQSSSIGQSGDEEYPDSGNSIINNSTTTLNNTKDEDIDVIFNKDEDSKESNVNHHKKISQQLCNSAENKRRAEDMSSDSDFDEKNSLKIKRRPALRTRSSKLSIGNQRKNGLIQCKEPTSTIHDEPTKQNTPLYSRKHEWISLRQHTSPNKLNNAASTGTNTSTKKNTDTLSPCRALRSNNLLLEQLCEVEKREVNEMNDYDISVFSPEQENTTELNDSIINNYITDKSCSHDVNELENEHNSQKGDNYAGNTNQVPDSISWKEDKGGTKQKKYRLRSRSESTPNKPVSQSILVDQKQNTVSNNNKLKRLTNNIKKPCNSTTYSPIFGRFQRAATTSA